MCYPEWTDVLVEEEMGLKKGLEEMEKGNRELVKLFED
jgi:hypothetical protein